MHRKTQILSAIPLTTAFTACSAAPANPSQTPYAHWQNGPPKDDAYFPIAVWLQEPADAPLYKAAGINLYVGLWNGPTESQLAALTAANMPVICDQNAVGLKHIHDPIIVGWMHGDEPDNAETSPGKDPAGNPLPKQPTRPSTVIAEYQKFRRIDPTRPIMLNLGQGVANDDWQGRGKDNGNFDIYKSYVQSGDIISFDVYPVSGNGLKIRGNLALEARGLNRLTQWTHGQKILWNCIECTQINGDRPDQITPDQMKNAVWTSLIHGSTGLIYFVHQFVAGRSTRHLLEDPAMLAAVTAVNQEIQSLAPILNSPTLHNLAQVTTTDGQPSVDLMTKRKDNTLYLFAAAMTNQNTHATFQIQSLPPTITTAEVLGESRTLKITNGQYEDAFTPYQTHRYIIHLP